MRAGATSRASRPKFRSSAPTSISTQARRSAGPGTPASGKRRLLAGGGADDRERLEEALSEAASITVHLLRNGTGVELAGVAGTVPLGRGKGQERRILTALALYAPPGPGEGAGASDAELREIRIGLDSA